MPHGQVQTPIFMPVATRGSVRAQDLREVERSGAEILLSNTYHLMKTPGLDLLERMGGLHKFTNWKKGFLTDSGGYQVFSLRSRAKLDEKGVVIEGQKLTPEIVSLAQHRIGSDIHMVLDQCVPSDSPRELALEAMNRTHRWALRARAEHHKLCEVFHSNRKLFAIVQVACDAELRKQSVEFLSEYEWDGLAVGGLAVGESRALREEALDVVGPLLPVHKPHYLMGVGTPIDLLEAVHRGIDMFDCILPTAFAQQGMAFSFKGRVQLRRGVYSDKQIPIEDDCPCPTCAVYTRAYLNHLIKNKELMGWQLIGTHNLYFYKRLMARIHRAIEDQSFYSYYLSKRDLLAGDDVDFPVTRPRQSK